MSLLSDWIGSGAMHKHGETPLSDIVEAFKGAVCTTRRLREEWPTGRIVQELVALGYHIEPRGRKDQPIRTVVGLSFEPAAVDEYLKTRIVAFLYGNSLSRFVYTGEWAGDDHGLLTIRHRDANPADADYRLSFTEIAAKASAAGIPCTERDVKIALQEHARTKKEFIEKDGDWTKEECESWYGQYIRSVTDDAVVDRRWLVEGEKPRTATLRGRCSVPYDPQDSWFGESRPPVGGSTSIRVRITPC